MPRKPSEWPDFPIPMLVPMTGFRDQGTRITYIPWTDAMRGFVGWEVIPDRRLNIDNILVYIVPTVGEGQFEIRCHMTMDEPDPETDRLLGKIVIPRELLGGAPE